MDDFLTIPHTMANGNQANIASIITGYTQRLLGFIRRRVSSEVDAEDILQDVFYQLLDNEGPVEQMTAWLFRVARNKIIDKQRKKKPLFLDDLLQEGDEEELWDWAGFLAVKDNHPETEILRELFWQQLYEALDELPPEQKNVFIQHELEEIPFKQIAEQTAETINTLISRKRYAVLHLRKRLATLKDEFFNY